MDPYTEDNQPQRERTPVQIDKSNANPMPIVAALAIMAVIVLGWVLFAEPQGSQSASNTAAPPTDTPVRAIEPKAPDAGTDQRAREKVEPEK